MQFFTTLILAMTLLVGAITSSLAATPNYPHRPVTIVVPFPPGGPTDNYARLIAQRLSSRLGQPFIVVNRPGATGTIGTAFVAKAKPDGYTLLFSSNSSQIIAPILRIHPPYDGIKDFTPITLVGRYPFVLVVNNEVPVHTPGELIALAKSKPNGLFFGSIGEGSGTHLMAELFLHNAGIKMTRIPYKGGAAVTTALISGEIQMYFDSISSSKPFIDAGRLRAIAVTGEKRSPLLPAIPTLRESGLGGFDPTIWLGLFAPKGTSSEIVQTLYRQIHDDLRSDDAVKAHFDTDGIETLGTDPARIAPMLSKEKQNWTDLIDMLHLHKE